MSPGSFEAALRAAGGAVFAVDEVWAARPATLLSPPAPPDIMLSCDADGVLLLQ